MAKINIDDEGLVVEPCLSCEKSYIEDIWNEWFCDEKECLYRLGGRRMRNTEAEIAKLEKQKRDIEKKIKQIKLGTANYGIVELGCYEYPRPCNSSTGNTCDWYIGIETERKFGDRYRNTITKTVIVHSRDEVLEKLDILIHDLQELRKICREDKNEKGE